MTKSWKICDYCGNSGEWLTYKFSLSAIQPKHSVVICSECRKRFLKRPTIERTRRPQYHREDK